MENLFDRIILCYLTNRYEDAFQLFKCSTTTNHQFHCQYQHEIFFSISINLIEKRYKSLKKLNEILSKTNDINQCFIIENYIEILLNEIQFYSNDIFNLIQNNFIFDCLTSKICFLKFQGDIHLILSQIYKSNEKIKHLNRCLFFYDQSLHLSSKSNLNHLTRSIIENKNTILFHFNIII